jgi:coenzyme F420-0:L-glutamate ligase / coenzyme F420-1:gamma-L-glutamate ligase
MNIIPIRNIPLIKPGDDLSMIIAEIVEKDGFQFEDNDVLVLAQKIVSKSEGRLVNLTQVKPSDEANRLAEITGKEPEFIELVLRESKSVLRTRGGVIIVEHNRGFICANAGIDHSNVEGPWGNQEDWILLLPENPDESSKKIRDQIKVLTGKNIGVMIIDSHGRAWRMGIVGVAIGVAGVPALVDLRGEEDMFGYQLKVTQVAAADELAAAASLVMGQAAERIPAVLVRGFPYPLRESSLEELIRPKEMDLFR